MVRGGGVFPSLGTALASGLATHVVVGGGGVLEDGIGTAQIRRGLATLKMVGMVHISDDLLITLVTELIILEFILLTALFMFRRVHVHDILLHRAYIGRDRLAQLITLECALEVLATLDCVHILSIGIWLG